MSTTAATLGVLGQQGHPAEGLGARRARVLLHVRMRLQMGAQVRAVGESTLAVLAVEGLLAGVRADVALQQPGAGEGLAADVALAGQRVRANVHLEGAQRHVHLVAVLAAERLLRLVALGSGTVELLVLGQAAEGGVGLAAVGARVPGNVAVATTAAAAGRLLARLLRRLRLVLDVGRLLAQGQSVGAGEVLRGSDC